MHLQNNNVVRGIAAQSARSVPRQRPPLSMAVSMRQQSSQESQTYITALDAVLAEWVRQHLSQKGK